MNRDKPSELRSWGPPLLRAFGRQLPLGKADHRKLSPAIALCRGLSETSGSSLAWSTADVLRCPALPTPLAAGAAPSGRVSTACSLLNGRETDKIPSLRISSSAAHQ